MEIKKAAARGFLFASVLFMTAVSSAAICAAQTYGSGLYGGGTYNNGSGGGADTTAPTVAVTAPAPGTVGGSITLTATASDDTDIAGIQFKIDTNTSVGNSGTASPYSITYDTTSVANGNHTIIAVAHDSAGNYATSSGVTITVNNTTIAPIFGGGGGGGGGGWTAPQIFMTPINSSVKTATSTTASVPGLPPKIKFTQNLILGSKGEQVKWLQIYLNGHGFRIAPTGPGSPGKETTIYGFATQAAVVKFQRYHGIRPAVGYFGPITRGYVNSTLK